MADKMREAFEAHYGVRYSYDYERLQDGTYKYTLTESDWRDWQAACRSQAKRNAEIARNHHAHERHQDSVKTGLDIAAEIEKEAGL